MTQKSKKIEVKENVICEGVNAGSGNIQTTGDISGANANITTKITSLEVETTSYISLTGYSNVEVEVISALNIDWDQSNVFSKSVSTDTTFTFSNDKSGQTLLVEVSNTDSSAHTIDFPGSVLWPDGDPITDIAANSINLYSFVKIGSNIHANGLEDMS